jgi:tetratricopeptide (TPR) repeat protein
LSAARARLAAQVCACAALASGCASTETPAALAPTQDLLEIVAVVRLHVDDDTYRFPAARDFTGKNVFRIAFERLESLETAHPEKLASGYATDVVWFTKARALERIGEYDLAMRHYARVTEFESELADAASAGRDVNARLAGARTLAPPAEATAEEAAAAYTRQREDLQALRVDVASTHWRFVIAEELERVDAADAATFAAHAALDARYEAAALERAQALVQTHRESKNHNRNLLALGDLYAAFSRRYAQRFPPPSLGFDPATFDEYAHSATRVYEVVAQQDGTVEKLEGAHRLEAFLGFTLQVYEERVPR